MAKVEPAIVAASHSLGATIDHAHLFADAILTTDLKRKSAEAHFKLGRETVRLAGVCKGSGMIGPRMALPHATMLAYLTTDAAISPAALRRLLDEAALIDGAGHMQMLTKIFIPVALPGIIAAMIFAFTVSWAAFVYPLAFL